MKVKVIGAGSIGNHLSQAARRMGWDVSVVDRDQEALRRMKEDIFPSRYGAWDEKIQLFDSANEPKGGFDVICIGTPPDVRLHLALQALEEKPKVLLLEKPLFTPDFAEREEFADFMNQVTKPISPTTVLAGYDHAVSAAIDFVSEMLRESSIGEVQTLDVEFRENWEGIFKAHRWLKGPADSYLGFTARGGGASGEHSHALHLFNHLALEAGLGQVVMVTPFLKMEEPPTGGKYDSIACFNLTTASGVIGRVVQDVVTKPTRKWVRLQGSKGFIEWICNGHTEGDLVRFQTFGSPEVKEKVFAKRRQDDFFQEMLHIQKVIETRAAVGNGGSAWRSPVSLESGLLVMEILQAARRSDENQHLPAFQF